MEDSHSKVHVQLHPVESFRYFDLWYKRIDCKRMAYEAEELAKLFRETSKEYGMALNAVYESAIRPMGAADRFMVMRFLAKNGKARGLENRVLCKGSALRRHHRSVVLEAQLEAKTAKGECDWDSICEASLRISQMGGHVAHLLAEVDAQEAKA